MKSMTTKIALILASGIFSVAFYLAIITLRKVVPENPPNLPLPFVYNENHLTDWSGLTGGATTDAKPVRTIVIHAPAK